METTTVSTGRKTINDTPVAHTINIDCLGSEYTVFAPGRTITLTTNSASHGFDVALNKHCFYSNTPAVTPLALVKTALTKAVSTNALLADALPIQGYADIFRSGACTLQPHRSRSFSSSQACARPGKAPPRGNNAWIIL